MKICFFLLLVFEWFNVKAQNLNIATHTYKIIDEEIADFTTDRLGNIYLLSKNYQLKKLDTNFDSVAVYNQVKQYGNLEYIDATNPLKLLLYYKDFATVAILDRFLNIRSTLNLRSVGILQCSSIAQSYDNNIWVFDELESKIKKIDENGKLLLESPDFRLLIHNAPHITRLIDNTRFLYGYDPVRGLLTMDYFGAHKNFIPFKNWKNINSMANGIIATDSADMVYYQPNLPDIERQPINKELLTAKKIEINGNFIYALLADEKLHIFTFSKQ